ncbi:hypothetical protein AWB69_01162 [Caballeronia udeis]|uniref:Uncharacterized protein n=1 Tax=Caballeronia udeis TaxID=1232866 RepID=A0A158FIQ9_9BURK|nr:hypothetical protein AWB69_01162 [Caballeronia udeis]
MKIKAVVKITTGFKKLFINFRLCAIAHSITLSPSRAAFRVPSGRPGPGTAIFAMIHFGSASFDGRCRMAGNRAAIRPRLTAGFQTTLRRSGQESEPSAHPQRDIPLKQLDVVKRQVASPQIQRNLSFLSIIHSLKLRLTNLKIFDKFLHNFRNFDDKIAIECWYLILIRLRKRARGEAVARLTS